MQAADTPLKNRLTLYLAKESDPALQVEEDESPWTESVEDRLSFLALQARQGKFEEAAQKYMDLFSKNPEKHGLGIYAAVCYSRLECHDVALDLVDAYLEQEPESICAVMLKACNLYKLHGHEVAVNLLQDALVDSKSGQNPLVQHNRAVFEGGDCRRVWESVASAVPEAETNLILYYLKKGSWGEAEKMASAREPQFSIDYVAKVRGSSTVQFIRFAFQGLSFAMLGKQTQSRKLLEEGLRCLQLVGSSETERDTILGRQCMAFCYLLQEQFDDAIVFLESIQDYLTDDAFRWNFALCLIHGGKYADAQTQLEAIHDENLKSCSSRCERGLMQDGVCRAQISYGSSLARCYVANGSAEFAWNLFLKFEASAESLLLLQQIADDSYITGAFRISARAFDLLHRLDPHPDHWRGKRGAVLGAFRAVLAHAESLDCIDELLQMLSDEDHVESDQIRKIIWKWSQENVA